MNLRRGDVTKMRIKRIEKEIRDTPYHKGTEHHIGRLRAKLSKLKEELLETPRRQGTASSHYAVKKQGDATVVLVGAPSVGKSTLLNRLTNAHSKVAPYAFTTLTVIPGILEYHDARIQILDVPGLVEGAEEGKGRGREVLSVIHAADLLVIITDWENKNNFKKILESLEKNGIRVNKAPPKVRIKKTPSGGIILKVSSRQELSPETIKEMARELGLKNAEISLNETLTMTSLIDAFAKNRVFVPAILVINKIDLIKDRVDFNDAHYLHISAEKGIGLEALKEAIWQRLNLMRVYLVRPGEAPNTNHPLIVKKNSHLAEISEKIGTEFAQRKTKAKIWGPSAKFPGQEVSLKTEALEGMQVRFI